MGPDARTAFPGIFSGTLNSNVPFVQLRNIPFTSKEEEQ